MTVTPLAQHRVEKPWGRHRLWPAFVDPAPDGNPVGEIWFDEPGDPALLIKYLFTSDRLSVQVHPDDTAAQAAGHPRGKAECWLILDAAPDSTIALGPKAPTDRATLNAAARDGSIVDLLDWRTVAAGDFLYSPPGTIHAIGAGITLIEVQQNVDLTYRLFDYGRPRELHLAAGLAVSTTTPYAEPARRFAAGELLRTPHFTVSGLTAGEHRLRAGLLIPFEGGGTLDGAEIAAGSCWRVTDSAALTLAPGGRALFAALP